MSPADLGAASRRARTLPGRCRRSAPLSTRVDLVVPMSSGHRRQPAPSGSAAVARSPQRRTFDAHRSADRCRRRSWRRPRRAARRRRRPRPRCVHLVAERVDDGGGRLAHALVRGGEGRLDRAGMAVDVADDASADDASAVSTAPIWLLISTTSFSPVVSRPCLAISTDVSISAICAATPAPTSAPVWRNR